jgi:NADPH:quinone reductase-like Zn-dependent oxidoreductase
MLAARAAGTQAVAVTDPVVAKRALALELGADLAVDPSDADVVEQVRRGLPWRGRRRV